MMCRTGRIVLAIGMLVSFCTLTAQAAEPAGDALLDEYFRRETRRIEQTALAPVKSLEEWQHRREHLRRQLLEMLGLDPMPERTELLATVTGTIEQQDVVVEKIHFQWLPGLYVTANLYRPREVSEKLPAILYVCGHGRVARDGVSFGNKVHYQHHGAWFARHGYVCLTIDTLQLGEIEGIHHGTHRYDRWWWLNRGYTPAGVEAWNCIRALDYLETRNEVDSKRMGVTGRSGGGAYSWWIAAIDDRIQVAVPVAGITDLQNHVVDGCVEGHCDCMYVVNTYRWDYPLVAALVAPRPLLISNTDRDSIFPLDGVYRTYQFVRHIYALYGEEDNVALQITAGGHADTQELRVHAFRWFNHHLRNDDSLLERPAVRLFEPEQLKVFAELPSDERNTVIDEQFTERADRPVPVASEEDWRERTSRWRDILIQRVFRAWPEASEPLDVRLVESRQASGLQLEKYEYLSQTPFRLPLYVMRRAGETPKRVTLRVLDEDSWREVARLYSGEPSELRETAEGGEAENRTAAKAAAGATDDAPWLPEPGELLVAVAPRGIGPTAWTQDARKRTQILRRFYLLGQTLDGMRVWDVRRAVAAVAQMPQWGSLPLCLEGRGTAAGLVLYAALFESDVQQLVLIDPPATHENGPILLNVSRFWEMPEMVAMAAERQPVILETNDVHAWEFARRTAEQLDWPDDRLSIEPSGQPLRD